MFQDKHRIAPSNMQSTKAHSNMQNESFGPFGKNNSLGGAAEELMHVATSLFLLEHHVSRACITPRKKVQSSRRLPVLVFPLSILLPRPPSHNVRYSGLHFQYTLPRLYNSLQV
jgi:hypothetical protein